MSKMFSYVNNRYGLKLKKGIRVKYDKDKYGVITHSAHGYVFIKLDGEDKSKRFHPTWNLEYLKDQTNE